MHGNASYSYAVLRVVPRVEREEFINAGVILYCRERRYLGCRIALDFGRLKELHPGAERDAVRQQLEAVAYICSGYAAGGPIAALPQHERFHWLTAPRSTMLQTSPVRSGICSKEGPAWEFTQRDLELRLEEIASSVLSPLRDDRGSFSATVTG